MAKDKTTGDASTGSAGSPTSPKMGKIKQAVRGVIFSKVEGYLAGDVIENDTEVEIVNFEGDNGYTPIMHNGKLQWIYTEFVEIIEAE